MTIGELKNDFDDHIEIITGAGVDPPPQPELAILFLTKLDPTRYAPMMAQLTNDATFSTNSARRMDHRIRMEGIDLQSTPWRRHALSLHSS